MAFMMVNGKNVEMLAAYFNIKTSSFNQSSPRKVQTLNLEKLLRPSDTGILNLASNALRSSLNLTSLNQVNFSSRLSINAAYTEMPQPSASSVRHAVDAVGRDKLDPWLIDGKTKLDIDGRRVEVTVDAGASSKNSDPRARAEQALARFGLEAGALDGDPNELKTALREKAAEFSAADRSLSSAIEYALEDAFAAIDALENPDSADLDADWQAQREKNAKQAESIVRQTGISSSQTWAVESLAEDLAVLGMDFSALSMDKNSFSAEIAKRASEKQAELDARYVGTETEYHQWTARISGSLSRLQSSAGQMASGSEMISAGVSLSVSNVSVGGSIVSVSKIVGMSNVISDPIVLDLNGDGIDLSSAEEGVEFDMDGDGQKTRTGFIRGDDALLFLDEDGDGVASSGRELFGNTDGYANGFEKLASYDENGDGVIDENDSIYHKLKLWVEKNEDGVCDSDEVMGLAEAGVKSISVGYKNTREDDGKGNLIGQAGSFTRDDGSSGMAADVWLREVRGVETGTDNS